MLNSKTRLVGKIFISQSSVLLCDTINTDSDTVRLVQGITEDPDNNPDSTFFQDEDNTMICLPAGYGEGIYPVYATLDSFENIHKIKIDFSLAALLDVDNNPDEFDAEVVAEVSKPVKIVRTLTREINFESGLLTIVDPQLIICHDCGESLLLDMSSSSFKTVNDILTRRDSDETPETIITNSMCFQVGAGYTCSDVTLSFDEDDMLSCVDIDFMSPALELINCQSEHLGMQE